MGKTCQFLSHGKNTYIMWLFLMVATSFSWAGIPSGYYDNAAGKSGSDLKSALHAIVSDHTKYSYTSSSTDVWDILKATDEDPENSSNVILLYTGRSQAKTLNSGEASPNGSNRWNREHVWSKSHGFPAESDTAYTDCHHLRPADESVNSSRSNLDFDDGGSAHVEATGCNYDSDSWEPRDAVKGDVARMMFYMVVRYDPGYHSDNSTYDLELVDYAGVDIGDPPGEPLFGKLSTLLTWHEDDPVDSFESNRNEVVYSYQGNRNPFIDHPEYVDSLWNDALQAPTNLSASNLTETTLTLTWADNATDESGYYIYQDDAKISTLSANITTTNITGLTSGSTYTFKVSAYRNTEESTKATLDVTTNGVGNLIISGVYDGPLTGGTPKGVELYVIANIADLSKYGVGSANNGGGTDGEEYTFPAVAATAGDFIYVASESPQFTSWFNSAPDYTSGSMGINGDDAVELFYNGSAIDVFGDISIDGSGQSWDYLDGWAYSKDDRSVATTFNADNWTYSGINALDGETTNASADTKVPVGTFSTTDSSLPVELSVWKATSSNGRVKLIWATESEIENQGFIIERTLRQAQGSILEWVEIASFVTNSALLGHGSTSALHDYSYIDRQVEVGESYRYRLSDVDYRGNVTEHPVTFVRVKDTGTDLRPANVLLHKAFPNPFNPEVNLSFTLGKSGEELSLEIFDVRGTLIQTLSSGYHEMGSHNFLWSGINSERNTVSSGVYLVRLSTGSTNQIQRVALIR
ncbi:MAG: T9SS type A sorting domain-containing protein [Candidatus Marinimicrobia bacterium]|jgi:endonuclease I|nr:T9SS type A sorting domain-containing protein [Candidatus Neomarinimicrobiota bacterium]